MRLTRQQRAAPDAHPESCWAVRCPPSHSPTSAEGSPQQAEIHPCPKDSPTSVGALWFFPPARVRLGRVCLLCYSSQNPGPNKAPSIGPVTLSISATGWQWSLPMRPRERDAWRVVRPRLRDGRAGAPCLSQHRGSEKPSSPGKQLILLLPEEHFKGNYWEERVILY